VSPRRKEVIVCMEVQTRAEGICFSRPETKHAREDLPRGRALDAGASGRGPGRLRRCALSTPVRKFAHV